MGIHLVEKIARPAAERPVKGERRTGSLPARHPPRTRRAALRVALFYSSPGLPRSFQALASRSGFALECFALSRFSRAGFDRRRQFDAVIVERPGRTARQRSLFRWLRQRLPETPFVAYRSSGRAPLAPVFSIRLKSVPTAKELRSLLTSTGQQLVAAQRTQRLSSRLKKTSKQLDILTRIVGTANSILEPKRVVALIMSHIQQLIPSEAWSILLVDEEKKELSFEMALGEKGDDVANLRLKLGEGIAGWVAQSGKPAIVNDVSRDSRFQNRFDELTQFRTRSILCAPLVSRGRTIGVVEILNRASRSRFSKRDLDLLLTLVEPAAIALENAILFQKTEELTITDDLTKLYNSRYLSIYLGREIKRARRQAVSLALIFLDLDGFKAVNDRHGHLYGSRTLYEVGSILKRSVRDTDIVGRYGGDEFVVVLPDTDARQAASIAGRIRQALKAHPFLGEFGLAVHLSASFGISAFPEHGPTPQDLIQKADQAMYSVKESGKDGVAVAVAT